jgi:hypothetical protein
VIVALIFIAWITNSRSKKGNWFMPRYEPLSVAHFRGLEGSPLSKVDSFR